RDYPRAKISLPTYPFERQRCWSEGLTRTSPADGNGGRNLSPLRLHPLIDRGASEGDGSRFEKRFRAEEDAVVREHRVLDRAMLPGVGFLEMALAAARCHLRQPVL